MSPFCDSIKVAVPFLYQGIMKERTKMIMDKWTRFIKKFGETIV